MVNKKKEMYELITSLSLSTFYKKIKFIHPRLILLCICII